MFSFVTAALFQEIILDTSYYKNSERALVGKLNIKLKIYFISGKLK